MSVLGRDLRVVDGAYGAAADDIGPPEIHVWARFRDDPGERCLHQALLAQATTHWTIAAAMRPHLGATEADAHVSVSTGIMSATIAFLDDVDVTEWMLYTNPAVYAGNGLVQGEGRVHCIDGRLLATYSVQGMVRGFVTDPASMGKDASNAM
jgi:acyl-CoA thioesterase